MDIQLDIQLKITFFLPKLQQGVGEDQKELLFSAKVIASGGGATKTDQKRIKFACTLDHIKKCSRSVL